MESSKIPFRFQVGEVINGAEVFGLWDQFGPMLHLPGPKRRTNACLPDGKHLNVGNRVDERIKRVGTPNRKVVVALVDTVVRQSVRPSGTRAQGMRKENGFE